MASCMFRKLSYDELKKQLKKEDKIIIYTCGSCVFWAGIGGWENMAKLAAHLKSDGYNVIHQELAGCCCVYEPVAAAKTHPVTAPIFPEATVIISLIDEEGTHDVQVVFPDKKVIPTCKSIGLSTWSLKTGNRVSKVWVDIPLEIPPEGMTVEEAAKKLGMYSTPFF